jgi:hypothetical protein
MVTLVNSGHSYHLLFSSYNQHDGYFLNIQGPYSKLRLPLYRCPHFAPSITTLRCSVPYYLPVNFITTLRPSAHVAITYASSQVIHTTRVSRLPTTFLATSQVVYTPPLPRAYLSLTPPQKFCSG